MPALTINGHPHSLSGVPLHRSVLDFLRLKGLTGTKCGCNEGDCGACTVLLLEGEDNRSPRAINACLALAHSLAGREILTCEGLASGDALHPAQQSMVDGHGSQCGYCTPGFVCSMAEASARGICHDPIAVADQLCGNLCRCTGYRPIRDAAATLTKVQLPGSSNRQLSIVNRQSPYLTPASLAEALALKTAHPHARFIAGATEIAVLINKQDLRPQLLISLEHVAELQQRERTDTHWHLGAAVPLTDLEDTLAGEFPALDQCFRLFASRQIRHRATLGGNLVTASPIGDSAPVLLALDATVTLAAPDGERTLALADFFTGYRKTALRDGEILKTITLPRHSPGSCAFHKVSKRREMDIATVSAAIRLVTDESDTITDARLAYGGVAPTPVRALQTEAALTGLPLSQAGSPEILALLSSEFRPLTDHRGTAEYRQHLIRDLYLKYLTERRSPDRPQSPGPLSTFSFPLSTPAQRATPHESATGHVTGTALYTHDLALRRGIGGILHIHPVRSTIAHATLDSIDISRALAAPGVHAVLTAADVPGHNNTGPARDDEPLFATDTIHFHGQLLAAVVADTPELAREAARLVDVTFTPLPPILGIGNAIATDSFHTDPHTLARGDVDTALTESPHLLEGKLPIGGQEHFYLETHAALAEPDGEGGFHVLSSTQHPSETQTIVAEVLGVPRHRVVVESPRMGGGFGSKETQANPWAALCAVAAHRTGRPATLQLDRDDDIESTGKRHPFLARYKVGYHPDGRLHAADIRIWSDGGWSLDLSLPVNDRALFHLDNAYYIPHARFTGRVCKTNVTSHTAFRGFGGPQGMLVIEEILGRIAEKLGLPAAEVRERNLYHGSGETNTTHYGEEVEDNRLGRIWTELLQSSEFSARRAEIDASNATSPHHKRGLAITPVKFGISFTLKHYNQAGALVLIYADGSVQVNHGGTEMGQGLHTKILGVAMRELGLPAERIRLMHTRTDKVPNTSATAASSGSDLNGMAVADACTKLRQRLAAVAADKLGVDLSSINLENGAFHAPDGRSLPFEEVTALAYVHRVPLSATGFYKTPDLQWDWSQPNPKGKPFHYFAFGAAVTEVELDGFTGMHRILRTDILHDVGDSLNPAIDRGQIEGGFVQGAGWLTCEELKWDDDGRLLTHSASTYAIPAFSDAPVDFRVSLPDEATQARTIHGSKAVGEPPLMLAISVREALRDAVHAFGKTHTDLPSPLTAEALKLAIGGMS